MKVGRNPAVWWGLELNILKQSIMKTEKNLILLDFMGVVPEWSTWSINWFYTDGVFCHISNTDREKVRYSMAEYAKYSTSWDWLMPVVEKIESLEDDFGGQRFNVQIEQCFCCIIENHTSQEIVDLDRDTKMEAVFAACVEFAKWYKKQ